MTEDSALDLRPVINELRRRRDALNKAIHALEALDSLPDDSGPTATAASMLLPVAQMPFFPTQPRQAEAPPEITADLNTMNLGEASLAILRLYDRGMTNQEVAEALRVAGYESRSKNMPNNVGTALWREKKRRRAKNLHRDGKRWVLSANLLP